MNIIQTLQELRNDIKIWVTNNLNALNNKIDEKTIPIDEKLDSTSSNPVQNKAIVKAINSIPKFSGSYNDLTDAPNIIDTTTGDFVVADDIGNIILKVDDAGVHSTNFHILDDTVATESYVEEKGIEIKEDIGYSIESESDEWNVVDKNNNIIFRLDQYGAHTSNLYLDKEDNPIRDIIESQILEALAGYKLRIVNTPEDSGQEGYITLIIAN